MAMTSARSHGDDEDALDEDRWLDPNLTEPRLQDEVNRRLNMSHSEKPSQRRPRPRAAYGGKSDRYRSVDVTQIRYYKYIPYHGMSEPEKQRYLSLGPARLTSRQASSRTDPMRGAAADKQRQEREAAASFWPSASRAKSLKVYDYHLAELSLAYRSPPSLLDQPRRLTPTPPPPLQQQPLSATRGRSLFYQMHSRRAAPASAPSVTQQQLISQRQQEQHEMADKTAQVSRGNTPFIDSAFSDYPAEPQDVVARSASNRLLNVVSVDECHVRHRRRRRRMRKLRQGERPDEKAASPRVAREADVGGEAEEEGSSEDEEEEAGEEGEEEIYDGDEREARRQEETELPEEKPATRLPDTDVQGASHEATSSQLQLHDELLEDHPAPGNITALVTTGAPLASTRPTTERSAGTGRKKRRTEKEMRQIAAAKFLRRNEILREKMSIYLDWKLNQERLGLSELRMGDPAMRFERFTLDLVQQEALVANQYRDTSGGGSMHEAESQGSSPSPTSAPGSENHRRQRRSPNKEADDEHRQEMSLTEMYEALNA